MLRENGTPVTGTRDMEFRFYLDDDCLLPHGEAISIPDVELNAGLFSVELPVEDPDPPHVTFFGTACWLGIRVEGTTVGCQEILPVPYALGLRPGASILGQVRDGTALTVANQPLSGENYGIYASSSGLQTKGMNGEGLVRVEEDVACGCFYG
jgi:hypothetical protein